MAGVSLNDESLSSHCLDASVLYLTCSIYTLLWRELKGLGFTPGASDPQVLGVGWWVQEEHGDGSLQAGSLLRLISAILSCLEGKN